jgi:hypothetical protein
MKTAHLKIKGTKPFLFHKFNLEALTNSQKPKEGTTGNNFNEWKSSFFYEGTKLYMPTAYMFAALKNGSVNTKVGRGTIQKTFISAVTLIGEKIYFNREMFPGWMDMDPENTPLDSSLPVYVDVRMVSNPNTKGKNVRYRLTLSEGWECDFHFEFDDSLISSSQVKKIVEDTGKLQGIGDARTLGYGRFHVVEVSFE